MLLLVVKFERGQTFKPKDASHLEFPATLRLHPVMIESRRGMSLLLSSSLGQSGLLAFPSSCRGSKEHVDMPRSDEDTGPNGNGSVWKGSNNAPLVPANPGDYRGVESKRLCESAGARARSGHGGRHRIVAGRRSRSQRGGSGGCSRRSEPSTRRRRARSCWTRAAPGRCR